MEITFDNSYGNVSTAFPENTQETRDDQSYYKKCAHAILGRYFKNATQIPYTNASNKRNISELRAYATGVNSPNKYKDYMFGKKANQNTTKKTSLNISWDVAQMIPQFVDVVRGYMQKFDYDILVGAIDETAQMDRELMKAEIKLHLSEEYKKFAFSMNVLTDKDIVPLQPQNPQLPQIPFNSEQEVEFFDSIGGFVLEEEEYIKTLLDISEDKSRWSTIKDMLIQDLITTSYAITHNYSDAGSFVTKYEYVDVANAIFPYSRYNDFRDMTYFGQVRKMTIAEIRTRYNLPEEDLLKISRLYQAKIATPSINSFDFNKRFNTYDNGVGATIVDSCLVDVFDGCWISTETQKMTMIRRNKENNLVLNPVDASYKLKEKDAKSGKQLKEFSQQTLYECSMVIGSDIMLHCGKPNNITYRYNDSGQREVVFPYNVIKINTSSLVERCIAFNDDLQMAIYKFRNALKKQIPAPGLIINESALQNVMINGVTSTPKMLLEGLVAEGLLIIKKDDEYGVAKNSLDDVIKFIPDNTVQMVNSMKASVEYFYEQMQRVTGINNLFAASTPSAETGVGLAKISISSTENSLFPIVNAYKTLYEKTAQTACLMWQIIDYHLPENKNIPVFVESALKNVKIGGALTYKLFNIKINAGLNTEEKADLLNQIRQQRDLRTQTGSGGITPSTYFMLWRVINSGNIPKAQLMLAQAEERQRQQDLDKAMQNSQQNAQAQQQSLQMASQSKMAEQQQAADLELRNILQKEKALEIRDTNKAQQKHQSDSTIQGNQIIADKNQQTQQQQAEAQQAEAERAQELRLQQGANQNVFGNKAGTQYSKTPFEE